MGPEQIQTISGFLLQSLEGEFQTTKRVLAALPDNKHSWRPHEKGRTAAELAWHTAAGDIWFLNGIADGKFDYESEGAPPATTAEIVAAYESGFSAALQRVKAMSPEALANVVDFLGMVQMPAGFYLNFAMVHSVHHRGQLSAYLRAVGATVPSIYGGSADEPMSAGSAQSAN
jgi:uncharacterized damage-inducible protein DinB